MCKDMMKKLTEICGRAENSAADVMMQQWRAHCHNAERLAPPWQSEHVELLSTLTCTEITMHK